ncbi:MAG: CBS domain-containing protein [Planctomycetes bacterium]|nr:CBS domain-containing protein [Planctomycetota bacterium]
MNVGELMTKDVATCASSDSLETAARIFWERDCGVLPVVDDAGLVIGMLTDRDACMAAYLRGARLAELRVGDAMAKHVSTCWPEDSIDVALARMAVERVRRIPIVDAERKLLGVVSLSDVARAAAREARPPLRERRLANVGNALAQIARPHCELAFRPERASTPLPRAPLALPSVAAGAREPILGGAR